MSRRVVIRRSKSRAQAAEPFPWRHVLVAGGFFCIAALLATGVWLWRSGWFQMQGVMLTQESIELTRRAGFSVNDILVEGRSNTEREEIMQVLGVEKGAPILAFNPHEALGRLKNIPWVKNGSVERRLPGTIFVRLNERKPIAIWQNNKAFKLIDGEGHVLRDMAKDEPRTLPLVVGEGAQKAAADLLSQIINYPAITAPFKAAVRVSSRRWDLHMGENAKGEPIVIKLPEENLAAALENLNKSITEQHILERNILGIDLRMDGRMIVETVDDIVKEKPKNTVPKINPATL